MKRKRNLANLTKAKFLVNQGPKNEFLIKDVAELRTLLDQIMESIQVPFGHPSSYKVQDMIQILKELQYISSSGLGGDKIRALHDLPKAPMILLHLLTNSYETEGPTKQMEKSELIQMLQLVCQALTNLISDHQICDGILSQYNMFSIMDNLL